ncbi:TIGR03088 family PEP-CTERM/XrtA system glycosyltransferase [Motiliproteus sp. SC1-56]|uniref:TIGR03088 family PEP-CTERM/XrtA system glycosyltransferase n=1 Tax=Motiliproteus sp. SC1-56 TaxID=2799565 RepID=UPI001A8F0360|nr:TIGR03088 family PEP-CTERM/XrtA system glycosyltransferase [Motiliproteus sp. SC1-56]
MDSRRHIAHIVYRFATGGLENGIVNLINHLPEDRYRHSIISLTDVDPVFARRLIPEVQLFTLDKRPGADWKYYPKMWSLLRRLKPDLVHTRNVATLEYHIPAFMAGVGRRIHGEHGWDMADLNGSNGRYIRLKKTLRPLIQDFIGLSSESCQYLRDQIVVPAERCHQIVNGVDTARFTPEGPPASPPSGFIDDSTRVFGSVGRLATVKNHHLLVNAFMRLCQQNPDLAPSLRLVIVGDGEHSEMLKELIAQAGLGDQVWFPGGREDIPALMRLFDVFVLPSLAEGISNTVLEALASGLPVIATRVGGNGELVQQHHTGELVACDEAALCQAMARWSRDDVKRHQAGLAARQDALQRFSLNNMVEKYTRLYQGQ